MLKSMTAYGRASVVSPLGRMMVELQSVNRKHLEINALLPDELLPFDADIKKWISGSVARGQVTVRVRAVYETGSPLVISPNLAMARQLREAWGKIARELGLDLDDQTVLRILSRSQGILLTDEDPKEHEAYRSLLQEAVSQALGQFVQMKEAEGKALFHDITGRLALMAGLMDQIEAKAPGATERYRQKLKERLQEVCGVAIENEEKLMREVCVYAEKVDIAEEITRFRSHLQQVNALLSGPEPSIGKTLEFIVQELNRETNTIGSKTTDVEVSRSVIAIKSELERIREQIQNVE